MVLRRKGIAGKKVIDVDSFLDQRRANSESWKWNLEY